jgi:hypothetical protein
MPVPARIYPRFHGLSVDIEGLFAYLSSDFFLSGTGCKTGIQKGEIRPKTTTVAIPPSFFSADSLLFVSRHHSKTPNMKKHFILTKWALAGCLFLLPGLSAEAQLLKKLKDKVNQKVDEAVNGKPASNTGTESDAGNSNSNNRNPQNRTGGGLKNSTPPDVLAQMTDAEKAKEAGNYREARYSIQQALVGVEIQIGREILRSLPKAIDDLTKDSAKNVVMSNQWGWSNLVIQTEYEGKQDKHMTINIGNNSAYAGLAAAFFNYGYVQANNTDQNVKQTRVKENKAIIQYDDSQGYTLIMPIGQTSMIVWNCINFATEDEVMKAANAFDVEGIKKLLGEK